MSDKKRKKDEPTQRTIREVTVVGVPTGKEYLVYTHDEVQADPDLAWVPAEDRSAEIPEEQRNDFAYYVLAQRTPDEEHPIPVPKKKDVLRDLTKIAKSHERRDHN